MEKVHVYIDMDGVLAKWDTEDTVEDTFERGYFLKRELEEKVAALIWLLSKRGIDVKILTSVYQNGYAAQEKKEWLLKNYIENEVIIVPYGEKKHEYVSSDGVNILLDDYTKNLKEWKEKGFVGIKFLNGINSTKGTWDGYTVSHRQAPETMMKTILGIAMIEGGNV